MGSYSSTDSNSTMAQEFVRDNIKENRVVVFSKTYCSFCKMAKDSLDKIGAEYKVIELDRRNDGNAIQDHLYQITGARSVPRVFIDGKCIGGGTETKTMMQNGKLQKMINGVE